MRKGDPFIQGPEDPFPATTFPAHPLSTEPKRDSTPRNMWMPRRFRTWCCRAVLLGTWARDSRRFCGGDEPPKQPNRPTRFLPMWARSAKARWRWLKIWGSTPMHGAVAAGGESSILFSPALVTAARAPLKRSTWKRTNSCRIGAGPKDSAHVLWMRLVRSIPRRKNRPIVIPLPRSDVLLALK